MRCTLPVATYWLIRSGSTVVANSSQAGHWKSDQTSTVTGALALPSARGFAGSIRLAGVGWSGARRPPTTVAFGVRTPDARITTTSPTTTAAAVIRAMGDCQAGFLAATVRAEARCWSRRAASRRSWRVAGGRGGAGVFGGRARDELEFVDMDSLDGWVDWTFGDAGAAYPVRDCLSGDCLVRQERSGPTRRAGSVAAEAVEGRATGSPPGR